MPAFLAPDLIPACPMIDYEEKRRFSRMRCNCAMSYKRVASGNQAHARCIDVSASGMAFEAEEEIKLGRALEIRTFPADRINPPITALVEVVRCEQTAQEGRYRVACVIKGIKSQAPESTSS